MSGIYINLKAAVFGGGAQGQNPGPVESEVEKSKIKPLSFCQRLVEGLDATPTKVKGKKRKKSTTPTILLLPMEIRQKILYDTIHDDELVNTNLGGEAMNLSAVCQTFRDEMPWVCEQWAMRQSELEAEYKSGFASYIDDLMSAACIDKRRLVGRRPNPEQPMVNRSARDRQVTRSKLKRAFGPSNAGRKAEPSTVGTSSAQGEQQQSAPFAAMESWRARKLEEMRRVERARTVRDWGTVLAYKRRAEQEKMNMKFKRLSFLTSDKKGEAVENRAAEDGYRPKGQLSKEEQKMRTKMKRARRREKMQKKEDSRWDRQMRAVAAPKAYLRQEGQTEQVGSLDEGEGDGEGAQSLPMSDSPPAEPKKKKARRTGVQTVEQVQQRLGLVESKSAAGGWEVWGSVA